MKCKGAYLLMFFFRKKTPPPPTWDPPPDLHRAEWLLDSKSSEAQGAAEARLGNPRQGRHGSRMSRDGRKLGKKWFGSKNRGILPKMDGENNGKDY